MPREDECSECIYCKHHLPGSRERPHDAHGTKLFVRYAVAEGWDDPYDYWYCQKDVWHEGGDDYLDGEHCGHYTPPREDDNE